DEGRESKRITRQEEAEGSSGDCERQCSHDDDRVHEITELDEKNQEDQHDGGCQHDFHLTECLLLKLEFSAVGDLVAGRKGHGFDLLARLFENIAGQLSLCGKGTYGKRAYAVPAHDSSRMPFRI